MRRLHRSLCAPVAMALCLAAGCAHVAVVPSLAGNSDPKGHLYIKFDIHFPQKLSNKHKQALIDVLKANTEENNL